VDERKGRKGVDESGQDEEETGKREWRTDNGG